MEHRQLFSNNKYPLQKKSQDPILSGFPGIVSHQAHFALTNDATCDLNPTKCGEMMWVDGCCFRGARVVWHAQLNAIPKPTKQLNFILGSFMKDQKGITSSAVSSADTKGFNLKQPWNAIVWLIIS